jgi:chromosome segregation ATPase
MSSPIITRSGISLAVAAMMAGCATQGDIPTQQLTQARTLVEQADKADAQRYAPADLQRAHDELSSADKAVTDHKYDDARRYAEKAQVDADLASARASSGEAQRAAQEVTRSIESLQQESERHANDPGAN